ncbi:MAG: hypothetical protein KJZ92_14525 [Rhodocyclaceae bacterium]|nr:hypothetical protein [Rhodocyclaceae bacterium]
MVLDKDRAGHIFRGRIYLAQKGVAETEHKEQCRRAYGSLHDVRVMTFKSGTRFKVANPYKGHWILVD